MRTAVIALTRNGSTLALKLAAELGAKTYLKPQYADDASFSVSNKALKKREDVMIKPIEGDFTTFIGNIFYRYDALVLIMATGIVVRSIAPYLKNKTTDPAVVVLDEKGRYVISLLSGHIGGANILTRKIAGITGGEAVITTATDVNGAIAFDVFAVENGCVIENIGNLKYISSTLVNGSTVELYSDYKIEGTLPENIHRVSEGEPGAESCRVVLSNRTDIEALAENELYIRPRNLILGIGCRRGTSTQDLKAAIKDFFEKNKRSPISVKFVATVDIKENEPGLLDFCSSSGLDLKTIPREKIAAVEQSYTCSDFVKNNIGVASVAEPCAVLAGNRARLVCQKTIYHGITLALAEEETVFSL